jgi:hypothetical protein
LPAVLLATAPAPLAVPPAPALVTPALAPTAPALVWPPAAVPTLPAAAVPPPTAAFPFRFPAGAGLAGVCPVELFVVAGFAPPPQLALAVEQTMQSAKSPRVRVLDPSAVAPRKIMSAPPCSLRSKGGAYCDNSSLFRSAKTAGVTVMTRYTLFLRRH